MTSDRTPVTEHALDFLCRARCSPNHDRARHRPAGGPHHAGHQAARREWDQLSDDDRAEVLAVISQHWSLNLNLAVRKMFHAASVLGFQADRLDPKHVAIVAASYLSRSPADVYDELAGIAK